MTPCAALPPEALAALHARAFTVQRPWSAAEFAALLADPAVFLVLTARRAADGQDLPDAEKDTRAGFLLGRVVLDEAELLTLAVDPDFQGKGTGGRLVAAFLAAARTRGAVRAFLEVAEDNAAARVIYERAGFHRAGRRRGYFARKGAPACDALVLARDLPES